MESMKGKVEERLQELRSELDSGRSLLEEIETKKANLQSTLLRISGAIQVLEELLASENESDAGGEPTPPS
jgi:predicted nuclease with TOPRIM domain